MGETRKRPQLDIKVPDGNCVRLELVEVEAHTPAVHVTKMKIQKLPESVFENIPVLVPRGETQVKPFQRIPIGHFLKKFIKITQPSV